MSLIAHMPLTDQDVSKELIGNYFTGFASNNISVKYGSALGKYAHFDSSGIKYYIPQLVDSKKFSVAFWAKFENQDTDSSMWCDIWSANIKRTSGSNELLRMESTYWSPGQFSIYNNGILSSDGYLLTHVFELDTWQHIVYTLEIKDDIGTSIISLYINGQLIETIENPKVYTDGNASFNGEFTIGDNAGGKILFNAADFKVYNHILSQDEIDTLQEVTAIDTPEYTEEYTELEYFETNGQYIDTDIFITGKTRAVVDWKYDRLDYQSRIFSASVNPAFQLYISGVGNNSVAWKDGDGQWLPSGSVADTNRRIYDLDGLNKVYKIDNGNFANCSLNDYAITQTSTTPLRFFANTNYRQQDPDWDFGYGKFYSAKIYEDGKLIRDFIPCKRNSDNIYGIFDRLNNNFFTPSVNNSTILTFTCQSGWEIIGRQLSVKANTEYILTFDVIAPNFNYSSEGTGLRVHILHTAPAGSANLKNQTNFAYYDIAPNYNGKVEIPFTCTDTAYVAINGGYISDSQTVSFRFKNMSLIEKATKETQDLGPLVSWIKYYNGNNITVTNALYGNIAIKDDKAHLLAPGSPITNVPCNLENVYDSGNTKPASPGYTYISKIQKGTPGNSSNYYISNIDSGLIKNLYKSKTINIGGSNVSLLYRRYNKMYWGFVVGRGGNRGGNGQYMADVRSGGGGGGAGTILFWLSVASDNTPSFNLSESGGAYTYTISCDGYTITLRAYPGSDGGDGNSSCNGGPGGGGAAGGIWYNIGAISSNSNSTYCTQYGPFYICILARGGTNGAAGGTWGGEGTAATNSVTINGNLRTQIGLSNDISWSRQDNQGGAAICPRINGSWYGSQGQGGGGGVHEYIYPL